MEIIQDSYEDLLRKQALLGKIATEFNIIKNLKEDEKSWCSRIIYSLAARMGYASLWDIQEDDKPASITYFKRRVENIVKSYLIIYPEVKFLFPSVTETDNEDSSVTNGNKSMAG